MALQMTEDQPTEPQLFGDVADQTEAYRKGYKDATENVRNHVEMASKEAQYRAEQEKAARRSPFKKFTQIADSELDAIRQMSAEAPVAAEIYWFLVKHMSITNAVSCGQQLLEDVTGKGRVTVYRAVKYLQEKRFIAVAKVGTQNVYHLNARVIWHADTQTLQYAEMNATLLLSPKENPRLKVNVGRVNHLQQIELPLEP